MYWGLCTGFCIGKCIAGWLLAAFFLSKRVVVNKVSIPSSKTSDAKPQQKSMNMMKSLVIEHVKWRGIIKIIQLLE